MSVKWKNAMIPADQIDVPKTRFRKDMGDIKGFAEHIREAGGLINPLCVRPEGERYVLLAGGRRYMACTKFLKLAELPCRIVTGADDLTIEERENEDRKDLTVEERYHLAKKRREAAGDGRSTMHQEGHVAGVVRRDVAAAESGLSSRAVGRAEKVFEHGIKEVRDLVNREDITLHKASQVAEMPKEKQKKFVEEFRSTGSANKAYKAVADAKPADGNADAWEADAEGSEDPKAGCVDKTGADVPEAVRDAFGSSLLPDAARDVKSIIKRVGGAKRWNPWLMAGDVCQYLKLAADLIESALPHAVCPACKADKKMADCKECRACGFMDANTLAQYQAIHG